MFFLGIGRDPYGIDGVGDTEGVILVSGHSWVGEFGGLPREMAAPDTSQFSGVICSCALLGVVWLLIVLISVRFVSSRYDRFD